MILLTKNDIIVGSSKLRQYDLHLLQFYCFQIQFDF